MRTSFITAFDAALLGLEMFLLGLMAEGDGRASAVIILTSREGL